MNWSASVSLNSSRARSYGSMSNCSTQAASLSQIPENHCVLQFTSPKIRYNEKVYAKWNSVVHPTKVNESPEDEISVTGIQLAQPLIWTQAYSKQYTQCNPPSSNINRIPWAKHGSPLMGKMAETESNNDQENYPITPIENYSPNYWMQQRENLRAQRETTNRQRALSRVGCCSSVAVTSAHMSRKRQTMALVFGLPIISLSIYLLVILFNRSALPLTLYTRYVQTAASSTWRASSNYNYIKKRESKI